MGSSHSPENYFKIDLKTQTEKKSALKIGQVEHIMLKFHKITLPFERNGLLE